MQDDIEGPEFSSSCVMYPWEWDTRTIAHQMTSLRDDDDAKATPASDVAPPPIEHGAIDVPMGAADVIYVGLDMPIKDGLGRPIWNPQTKSKKASSL